MMIKISDHLYEAAARLRGNNNFDNILEEIEKIKKERAVKIKALK